MMMIAKMTCSVRRAKLSLGVSATCVAMVLGDMLLCRKGRCGYEVSSDYDRERCSLKRDKNGVVNSKQDGRIVLVKDFFNKTSRWTTDNTVKTVRWLYRYIYQNYKTPSQRVYDIFYIQHAVTSLKLILRDMVVSTKDAALRNAHRIW